MPSIPEAELIRLQANQAHVRNICILAHVDHGKTTLSDSLLASNGIISSKLAGKVRFLDSRADEQERGITMESSAISLYFKIRRRAAAASIAAAANKANAAAAAAVAAGGVVTDQSNDTTTTAITSTTASSTEDSAANSGASTPAESVAEEYLINLIDSPGHVDFSGEVSTASRLCDGALVLVDAVEGVCTQTHTVLRQAWKESVRPVLVINKIDRLITELQFTPLEAYIHLNKILEQVNAVMGTFFSENVLEEDYRKKAEKKKEQGTTESTTGLEDTFSDWHVETQDDSHIYFHPSQGNVIFASAIDGWAFRVDQFAAIYAQKLGMKEGVLRKCLWGDFYLDPKTKRVIGYKGLKGRALKPLAIHLVLDNVWKVYDIVVVNPDKEMTEKVVKSLNLKVLPRDLRSKDTRAVLTTIFSQWLPLSTCVLLAVVEQLPSPAAAQKIRMPKMLHPFETTAPEPTEDWEKGMIACDPSSGVVAYVSKMVSVPLDVLPKNKRKTLSAEEMRERGRAQREHLVAAAKSAEMGEVGVHLDVDEVLANRELKEAEDKAAAEELEGKEALIGFSRIYSGTVRVGQKLKVLGPKYDPAYPTQHCSEVTVDSLFMIMGRDLIGLDQVPAGNVFGIGGLEGHVLKYGTLWSAEWEGGQNLVGKGLETAPIVRVALEPEDPSQMAQLVRGLQLLNQADPSVQVLTQETGEHVILTSGEVHLQRCMADLRERFARIEISMSEPIVPFRETAIDAPAQIVTSSAMAVNEAQGRDQVAKLISKSETGARGTIVATTPNRHVRFVVRTVPIPEDIKKYLSDNAEQIQAYVEDNGGIAKNNSGVAVLTGEVETGEKAKAQKKLLEELTPLFAKAGEEWKGREKDILAFGPRRVGPNLLINQLGFDFSRNRNSNNTDTVEEGHGGITVQDMAESILTGFQIATNGGPLCGEPMLGMAFFLQEIEILDNSQEAGGSGGEGRSKMAVSSGQVITSMRDACRLGFLEWSPRLMLAMYSCDIQTTAEVLGKVYAVIARRKGKILHEEMKEGTPFFSIQALLPVVESFGFSDDIRKRTSGAASPQLIFSHFEVLDMDPFWVPNTVEELEDLGEKADRDNVAKKYMDVVRKRKGLFVEQKIVEHAEKQRTLRKN
ncbi:Cytoplasmic GTPase/eEF2-like protein (ribosomal biogenesis) [Linnemannia gamsii]|uniref:Cytoplasmic GTPase/eEF2-like protein (Ribosomal biogenesis) n=1 Tax=Linnemannia gamsii TaxID=64522 RepID=A0ABQ7JK71_9FUNG|nr:Cytoplasmic GTPase/eEF2-like protein (ribosomal biogenesis) [Linnemannia gamsii]